MTVTANFRAQLTVTETIDTGEDLVTDASRVHAVGSDSQVSLNGSSSPPADDAWSDRINLTAGSASIDLTALARGTLDALDGTDDEIVAMKIVAASTNTAAVIIKPGSSNGYALLGDADGQVTLSPGASMVINHNGGLSAIGSSAKDIDLTSSDVDAIVDVLIVLGTPS